MFGAPCVLMLMINMMYVVEMRERRKMLSFLIHVIENDARDYKKDAVDAVEKQCIICEIGDFVIQFGDCVRYIH